MKIIVYGARVDEIAYFDQWAAKTGHQLSVHAELLDAHTVEWAKGFDGINCLQTTPYSPAVFEKMATYGIHYLTIRNVGTDNIDFPAAKRAGVRIANVPAYSPSAIAEFSVTLTLNLLRRLGEVERTLATGDFNGAGQYIGKELGQLTVGIVGAGRIGQAAMKLFHGFGAKVLAFDPHPQSTLPCEYVGLEELLHRADVVDLHVPGIAENDHMLDAAALAAMKPGAVLINTARGNLIDTTAMIATLQSGHLGGAGIDTYENETTAILTAQKTGRFTDPQWEELRQMPNVILTPHIAYHTETAVRNMVEFSLENLVSFVRTGQAPDEVGPHERKA